MANISASEKIYFPIRTKVGPGSLLAREVYRALHQHIRDRLADATGKSIASDHRHVAVLVDGKRGTGKSSVLFNLTTYLESEDMQLLGQVHILKPIDPTLLEDHDDLFLNIVVAAILSDKDVKGAMAQNSDARAAVYKRLHHLGHALESMQTQRDKKGLDKIRAFIGNQELMDEIHQLFDVVLTLLGKNLLVLPIDDVDTSLHRAFENLEVVRRYLTSPLVLPIISGDADLYQDVTWRDIHGRLLKESKSKVLAAQDRAMDLAAEYLRKVLPLQYRLSVPSMQDYFENNDITLGDAAGGELTFPLFHTWLEVLLNDRTNGIENSHLPVPILTVRAFSQLVYRLRDLIPALAQAVKGNVDSKEMLRHHMLISDLPYRAIEEFKRVYQSTAVTSDDKMRRNARDVAYSEFARTYGIAANPTECSSPLKAISIAMWIATLEQHFKYDVKAGAAFLVLKAYGEWHGQAEARGDKWSSVFDTPLFDPLSQTRDHADFEAVRELSDWKEKLLKRIPESWLKQLPPATILPYPVPEVGPLISKATAEAYALHEAVPAQRLLSELLLHRNFYQQNKAGVLVCVGRIFEIVITSLLRDMNATDIDTILNRPPFHSIGALAQTKTLQGNDIEDEELPEAYVVQDMAQECARLANSINDWRNELGLENLRLSPWLTYNVMNKLFNQAWYFNDPDKPVPSDNAFERISWVARQAFNSIWAAFGSFEKGELYGMPPIVATVNIGRGRDFQNSDLYRQNITPFVGKSGASEFGVRVGAITSMLERHPLKLLADSLNSVPIEAAATIRAKARVNADAVVRKQKPNEWLFATFGKKTYAAAARVMEQGWPSGMILGAIDEYERKYKNSKLRKAYEQVTKEKGK